MEAGGVSGLLVGGEADELSYNRPDTVSTNEEVVLSRVAVGESDNPSLDVEGLALDSWISWATRLAGILPDCHLPYD